MIYKEFGSTGLKLSAVGFGGMRFDDIDDRDKCAQLVLDAYDAGINYFDTAPGYYDGKSELAFAPALKQMESDRKEKPFYVSTKSIKPDPDDVRKDLEGSLTRLGVDYVDIFYLWCVKTFDEYQMRKQRKVLDQFEKLRAEGLVNHICVSTHMTGPDTAKMLQDYPFAGMLIGYSAMNFAYRDQGLEAAAKLNQGVAVMNPLGGGIIPQNPQLFDFLRTRPDQNVIDAALAFLIDDPRITTALVGFANKDQLDQATQAVDKFQPLSQQQKAGIRGGLTESFNALCTMCRYCDCCPRNIQIPELMDAWNHLELLKDGKTVAQRLEYHYTFQPDQLGVERCVNCGRCEELCTQKLPIIERLNTLQNRMKQYVEQNTAD